jgi:hypothetical protein
VCVVQWHPTVSSVTRSLTHSLARGVDGNFRGTVIISVFFGTHLSVLSCQLTKERLLYSSDIRRVCVSFLALQHRHHIFIISHAIEHCYDCLAHLVTAANEHLRMCVFMCKKEHACESMCIQNARPSATHTHARLRHCTHTTRLNRHMHMRVCVCVCVCV